MIKNLLKHIVCDLVSKPDSVKISERRDNDKLILEIFVDSQDVGKIIGREGRTIKALRSLIISLADDGQEMAVDVQELK